MLHSFINHKAHLRHKMTIMDRFFSIMFFFYLCVRVSRTTQVLVFIKNICLDAQTKSFVLKCFSGLVDFQFIFFFHVSYLSLTICVLLLFTFRSVNYFYVLNSIFLLNIFFIDIKNIQHDYTAISFLYIYIYMLHSHNPPKNEQIHYNTPLMLI